MAFQTVMSGVECAASSSALGQFMKHTQDDRSLHQDRFGGARLGTSASSPFRSSLAVQSPAVPHAAAQMPAALMAQARLATTGDEFDLSHIVNNTSISGAGPAASASDLEAAFRSLQPASSTVPGAGLQFPIPSGWTEEFHRAQAARHVSADTVRAQQRPEATSWLPSGVGMGMGMGSSRAPGMVTGFRMSSVLGSRGGEPDLLQAQQPVAAQQHQSIELSDEKWEAEFAKLDEQVKTEIQAENENKGKAKEDRHGGNASTGAFMEETEKCMYNETERLDTDKTARAMEESAHTRDQMDQEPSSGMAQTHRSAQELPAWLDTDLPQETIKVAMQDHSTFNILDARQGLKEKYMMQPSNPFLLHPDPMTEGTRLLADGGSLSDVTLLLEAATQRTTAPASSEAEEVRLAREQSDAWRRLGEAHAMNEMDLSAIRALEKAVEIDPSNLKAYIPLAVSYTNEGYERSSWRTLKRYSVLAYPHLKPPAESSDSSETFREVTDLFLQAAREGAAKGVVDADVQVGLGVLFFSIEHFEQASDCFQSALAVRPDDFLLWNRLGAVLANSGSSEQAIPAYHRALELRPFFTRAIYNLSVSCEFHPFCLVTSLPLDTDDRIRPQSWSKSRSGRASPGRHCPPTQHGHPTSSTGRGPKLLTHVCRLVGEPESLVNTAPHLRQHESGRLGHQGPRRYTSRRVQVVWL